MRNALTVAAIGAALFVAGCIPSLHPLYTEDDLIFEPALLGAWNNEDETEVWTFEQRGGLEYLMTVDDGDDGPVEYDAHLMELGSHRFLDVFIHDRDVLDRYGPHLLPTHTFYRIEIEADTVRMVGLDEDWLKDEIEAGEVTIAHEFVRVPSRAGPGTEDLLVLTASTEELQAFVTRYADDPEAFRSTGEYPPAWELQRRATPSERRPQ
jgi:hypothetical protein